MISNLPNLRTDGMEPQFRNTDIDLLGPIQSGGDEQELRNEVNLLCTL